MDYDVLILDEIGSTNSYVAEHAAQMPHGAVVAARRQVAGRGQRGNSWESAPDKNITMSMLLRPELVEASAQFVISEMVAVAVVNTLHRYLPQGCAVAVKWPNDIYVDDRKICGVLIENAITGTRISRSIVGIGLNVNQAVFVSDAPNPVSMHNVAGHDFDVPDVLRSLSEEILAVYDEYASPARHDDMHRLYRSMLWRGKGVYPYVDASSGEMFMAEIRHVAPMGHITLCDTDGRSRVYAFKEVQAVL